MMTIHRLTYFSVAALLAVSTQANAQTFTQNAAPDATRIVSDPLYLPYTGEFLGTTGYSYGTTTQQTFDSTGTRTNSSRININTITQELEYGVTDDFIVRANWDYLPSRDVTRDPVGGTRTSRSSSGFDDPGFGLTYRVLDQRDNPFMLDLTADYSPDAFPSKTATTIDDGTVARGGQMFDIGGRIGHVGPVFTVAMTFDAQYLDRRNTLNQNTGDFTVTDPFWNYTLGVATQTRLTDQFSFNVGAGHTFNPHSDVMNDSTGIEHFSHIGDSSNINASLNYHFIPNRLVGSVDYRHNFYDTTQNIYPTVPTSDNSIRGKNEDVVGVSLRYVMP